ncbi:hypothetical protein B296_00046731 [Ensete ventricosum]|uniref:Uncharacterized protein n=1 Tax=Ensete ventricosum TaxID=4639 RepID=A0A426X2Z1_ENSVE|nr:hypothetical protein B296_00046731 [Ensete ventricosum]
MQGWPPTAKAPYKVAISCGKTARAATARGHNRLQCDARKGGSAVGHPQGAVACSQPYHQPPLGKADADGQGQPPPVQGQRRRR